MFHHSFEHVPDPARTLAEAVARLAPGGTCLLRMPVASSWACEHYGVRWVGLDAPRHLCVFTVEGVRRLAARESLDIREVVYDSTELQFWGSERYERGQPLLDAAGGTAKPLDLTPARRRELRRRAAALNASEQGDEAAFYLVRNRSSAAET
jgi:SAM-dependent methyltransferase